MTEQIKIDIADNGIAVFDGYFSKEICESYINFFDEKQKNGEDYDRWHSNKREGYQIEDASVDLMDGSEIDIFNYKILVNFNNIFWQSCYPEYSKKFSVLSQFDKHQIRWIKIQKTMPGQGYHVWHCETDKFELTRRIAAFILYLNDVEDGGETEFLYLKRRIKPQQGRLLIFPSGYAHAHRGNPPLSGNKYILTGWLEF